MSVTFTQLKQTIDLAEKVKVDSGEKIVKTDKVGRKKNIEVTVTTKGGKFFVYFDKEKYAGSYRSEKDAEKIVKDYLKLVGEELQENRAKRDAFKAMGRRKGKDAADIDNTATDDDRKAADKNIMMQLRKAVSLRGMKPIEFADGKKAKINPKDAEKMLAIYDKLKPASKLQLQTVLAKSKRDFDKAVQKLKENEYFDESLEEGKMKQFHQMMDDGKTADQIAKALRLDLKTVKELMKESVELIEAGLPPHLAKLFDKDGNFKDPKKQKIFNRMMGDGIGKEIAQKMGRIKFRVDADSAKKKVKVYVDSNDEKDAQRALKNHPAYVSGAMRVIPEEVELDEAPKMKYALVGKDMKIYSMGSDERDLRLDRRSLEKRFKDAAPLKIARLKTAQAIGDKVDKSQLKEELEEGTWALPDTSQKKQGLKKAMSKPIKLGKGGDDAISVVGAFIGDDELYDDLGVAGDKNPNGDARPIVSKWMKKNFKGSWSKYAIEEVELDERRFTPKQIKMAIGVASDKRYKGGNMTGAVKAIEKIARGLSKDKQVAAVLRRQNEDLSLKDFSERELTTAEKNKIKKLEKEVPMKDFTDRYGEEKGKAVFYATITKMAKNED